MIYEVLLTLLVILFGILIYRQYVRRGRIYLFQEAVHMRFSASYFEEGGQLYGRSSLVKLRLELLALTPLYKGICIEEMGFLRSKTIRFREFNRFFFTASSSSHNARELYFLVDTVLLPEIRLNGVELYVRGHLLSAEGQKYDIYQKFIVFERPATMDVEEKQSLA